ncbi:transcriptional activator HAP5 [Podospora australis]|uniref:Transcriptional activator HAP5 n=1 Tax=Podospora australis TaxID=1536484 RepID=A0AAN6WVF0_9PEZI|nr:transcriptional activator HAP5 [Podospora australis]
MDPQNQSSAPHGRGAQQQQPGQQQQQQPGQQQQQQPQPVYDITHHGHYGASVQLSQQGFAPSELYTGTWANVHQGLTGQYKDILTAYWQQTINHLESDTHDYKMHQLPLARIKKVMKADPEVKMISAEAPILFAKGCDIFITELTMRAWIHAEENKRRTLQRSDIASALAKSDMFDFLIDIVPREEAGAHAKRTNNQANQAAAAAAAAQQAGPSGPLPGVGGMAPADYGALGGHQMPAEGDYRNPGATMYPGQVQPGAPAYGQPQPQMYAVDDTMYYSQMPPQQVRFYEIPPFRAMDANCPKQSA